MCNIITENSRPFGIVRSISRSHDLIGGQIPPEIILAQVLSLASRNRLVSHLKVVVIGLLGLSKLCNLIIAIYEKPQ